MFEPSSTIACEHLLRGKPVRMRGPRLTFACTLVALLLAGCGGDADPTRPPASEAEAPGGILATAAAGASSGSGTPAAAGSQAADGAPAGPTIVARAPRTATPTAVDPLAPVPSKAIAGIVVPAGAELGASEAATADTDARADYRIEGVDAAALAEWFSRELPEAGWGEPEDRDGVLVFIHPTQLSARFAGLGQKRTATVLFDLEDEVDFTLIVEAPEE